MSARPVPFVNRSSTRCSGFVFSGGESFKGLTGGAPATSTREARGLSLATVIDAVDRDSRCFAASLVVAIETVVNLWRGGLPAVRRRERAMRRPTLNLGTLTLR